MTLYIGVDIHARQQTLSYLDSEDGTTGQVVLDHEVDEVAGFYGQFQGEVIIGIEACGYTNWFEELVERLGHDVHVVVGSERNLKITRPGDLELAQFYLAQERAAR